jgi:predicted transcriptional regulator
MPRQKSRVYTEVELEFLKIIWDIGEPSPDDIDNALQEKGRVISPGSIRNVLSIMMEKGYISRRKAGKGYLYRAKVAKDQAAKTILSDMLAHAFEGSESMMIAALLGNRKISREEIDKIHKLLESHEKGDQK